VWRSLEQDCWHSVFGSVYRVEGRLAASTIASALVAFILLPFTKGLNVGHRDRSDVVTKLADHSSQAMRGGTGSPRDATLMQSYWKGRPLVRISRCYEVGRSFLLVFNSLDELIFA